MVRSKLTAKRIPRLPRVLRRWLPKEKYEQYKIKMLLPEQKVVDIKKNRQVMRTITVRRKTEKFSDR